MTEEAFIKEHCCCCGSQRCEGIGTAWFEGCVYKWDLDGMQPAKEINRLNLRVMKLAHELAAVNLNKSGKWIKEYEGNGWNSWDNLTCSLCETKFVNPTFPMNFCPKCGAKMELEKE